MNVVSLPACHNMGLKSMKTLSIEHFDQLCLRNCKKILKKARPVQPKSSASAILVMFRESVRARIQSSVQFFIVYSLFFFSYQMREVLSKLNNKLGLPIDSESPATKRNRTLIKPVM
jgi:hypothetical protein